MNIGGTDVDIRADDLTVIEELGRGAYGVVEKVSISFCLLAVVYFFLYFDDSSPQNHVCLRCRCATSRLTT